MKKKLSKPHSTLVPTAEKLCKYLTPHESVTRISAGVIQSIGSGPVGVKITPESGAILLQVRCSNAVQDVRVYGDHAVLVPLITAMIGTNGWER